MAGGMYSWEMPTERLKREYEARLNAKDEVIAKLNERISQLEHELSSAAMREEEMLRSDE
jgi:CII-binding regulator of phage lambda lysogenization HflD